MILLWILLATVIMGLLSLVGIITFILKKDFVDRILILLVGFSAGALIGGAFINILPEAISEFPSPYTSFYILIGFVCFFVLERYLHWRHCHDDTCKVHAFTYLNLVGDGLHNFIDGLVIAVAFLANPGLGLMTTLAIVCHEIPHELGNFCVLVYGGFSRKKALIMNFIFSLTAIAGGLIGYFMGGLIHNLPVFLLPFTAGGFIYVAASDLIPEIHNQPDIRRANWSFLTFMLGIGIIWLGSVLLHH